MTQTQQQQLTDFQSAKNIALKINKGCYKRALNTNYCGFKDASGRMWVIGDTNLDIQNADATINGKPAREVFGEFTVMAR